MRGSESVRFGFVDTSGFAGGDDSEIEMLAGGFGGGDSSLAMGFGHGFECEKQREAVSDSSSRSAPPCESGGSFWGVHGREMQSDEGSTV